MSNSNAITCTCAYAFATCSSHCVIGFERLLCSIVLIEEALQSLLYRCICIANALSSLLNQHGSNVGGTLGNRRTHLAELVPVCDCGGRDSALGYDRPIRAGRRRSRRPSIAAWRSHEARLRWRRGCTDHAHTQNKERRSGRYVPRAQLR